MADFGWKEALEACLTLLLAWGAGSYAAGRARKGFEATDEDHERRIVNAEADIKSMKIQDEKIRILELDAQRREIFCERQRREIFEQLSEKICSSVKDMLSDSRQRTDENLKKIELSLMAIATGHETMKESIREIFDRINK